MSPWNPQPFANPKPARHLRSLHNSLHWKKINAKALFGPKSSTLVEHEGLKNSKFKIQDSRFKIQDSKIPNFSNPKDMVCSILTLYLAAWQHLWFPWLHPTCSSSSRFISIRPEYRASRLAAVSSLNPIPFASHLLHVSFFFSAFLSNDINPWKTPPCFHK